MPWPLPTDPAELLQLAKSYPYEAPESAYLLHEGQTLPLAPAVRAAPQLDALFAGRTAVVAHGSNRSPVQLLRKFGPAATIPVTFGWLADHDVVYSAHLTRYGSIASNLVGLPGCKVRVAVNWLDDDQLRRMHATEGANYPFGVLDGVSFGPEPLDGPAGRTRGPVPALHAYVSQHGCLRNGAEFIGLAAVSAKGRPHGALTQAEVLAQVCGRYRPGLPLDEMILGHVRDAVLRRELIALMAADAQNVPLGGFRVLSVLNEAG